MTDTLGKHDTGFTQVSNKILADSRISAKAKGIYAYLFSKPEGWQFYISIIKKELKEGYKAFHSGIKELVYAGYIRKTQKNENGKFGGNIYDFATSEEINRLAKMANRQNGKTNNTYIKNNTKEKAHIEKKKSLRDTESNPYGVNNQEDTMTSLDDIVNNAKKKTKEATDKRNQKKLERASAFTNKKSDATLLEEYFFSLLKPEQRAFALKYKDPQDIYKINNDCIAVGITNLEDKRRVLKYFVDFWEREANLMHGTNYHPMQYMPNLHDIQICFFEIGAYSYGYGMNIDPEKFKKGGRNG